MVFCVFRVSHFFSLSDSLLRARENKQIQSQQGKEFAHHLKLIFLVIEKKELLFSLCFLLFLSLSPPLPTPFPSLLPPSPRAQGSAPPIACLPPSAHLERLHRCTALGRTSLECAEGGRSESESTLGEQSSLQPQHVCSDAAPTAPIPSRRRRHVRRFGTPTPSP